LRIPRFNRLTGFRWWRQATPRDDSEQTRLSQSACVSGLLRGDAPCAIGKLGTTEILSLEFFERWIRPPWPASASWRRPARRLYECSGVFPVRRDIFENWAKEYRASMAAMDALAQWQPGTIYEGVLERRLLEKYGAGCRRLGLSFLHFLLPRAPWLDDLAPLRWLVVSPFRQTIQHQLPKLSWFGVFDPRCAASLSDRARDSVLLACPQFAYMVPPRHRDWFHALEEMKEGMEREKDNFDIALVGAGAWSLPLVAQAKRMGTKGMHLGGTLQLLFGIKGGRFDNLGVYNEHWIRPLDTERPANHRLMENGAYW